MRGNGMRVLLLAFAVGMVGLTLQAQERSPAEVRLQAALHAEEVEGNLTRAIELYREVATRYGRERDVAARALFYLGRTYEKQGSQEATRAYQRVVREYGDQSEVATQARERLAALQAAAPTVAGRGPVARRLLSSWDSTDRLIENPRVMVPSPDGRRVAYAQTGSGSGVYVRDLASGAVQQVATREPTANTNNFTVVWSADGRRLAFLQTSGETPATTIRIFDFTSRETVAIPGLDARGLLLVDWSRDGRYLLCSNLRGTLDLVAVADGRMTTLSDSTHAGSRASFSPDGRFVAFAAGQYGSWTLYAQPVAGGARQRIAETRQGVYLHPLWSPDGRAIAYQHPDGVWVAPMADGVPSGAPRLAYRTSSPRWGVAWTEAGGLYFTINAQREIPYQVAVDPATGRSGDAGARELPHHPDGQRLFAWSPDMQRIAFASWDGDLTIYAVDGDRMTSQKVAASDEGVGSLWWSSDGREVQYEHIMAGSFRDHMGATVKALDAATGRVRELFPRMSGRVASLSADGRTMLTSRRAADSAVTELLVAPTGQPDGRVVATAPTLGGSRFIAGPKLSPQGDRVLFVRGGGDAPNAAWTLWVVGSDGTGARQLAPASAISSAMWDPSGRFIGYTGRADGRPVLRVVEVATGVERDLPLPSAWPRWQITDWSRDGRFIGVEKSVNYWEYWVVQGLLEGGR
jgi:Tol biopolymer transport system component